MIEPVASTSPLVRRYTLEEFFELPPPPGGGRYELIAGVLYMVPPPASPHYFAASRLVQIFARYVDTQSGRCTLFVPVTPIWTPADTYLEPDLLLIRTERLRAMDAERLTSADLVVEIFSPSNATYDRTTKADTYAALGVAELWLVDPDMRVIEQRLLEGASYRVHDRYTGSQVVESSVFPGLRATPDAVFG